MTNRPPERGVPCAGGPAGFTLAEAVVALSLLTIVAGMVWSFYLFAHKQVTLRETRAFEFDNTLSLLEAVAKNVRLSRATIFLNESQWVFISERGDTASYVFSDSGLRFNRVILTAGGRPFAPFSFDCMGNDSLLDVNADGVVDFHELDLDGDGTITGKEAESIAWIRASVTPRQGGDDMLYIVEAVKNNCISTAGGPSAYY
jgi:hypothetical protein